MRISNHHVKSHDYYIILQIAKKSHLLEISQYPFTTSRPPGGEDRYRATERPTAVLEDVKTFLFHIDVSSLVE